MYLRLRISYRQPKQINSPASLGGGTISIQDENHVNAGFRNDRPTPLAFFEISLITWHLETRTTGQIDLSEGMHAKLADLSRISASAGCCAGHRPSCRSKIRSLRSDQVYPGGGPTHNLTWHWLLAYHSAGIWGLGVNRSLPRVYRVSRCRGEMNAYYSPPPIQLVVRVSRFGSRRRAPRGKDTSRLKETQGTPHHFEQ